MHPTTLDEVVQISKPLRRARSSIAHGSEQQQQQVSRAQLLHWAEEVDQGGEDFELLLRVTELFSQPGTPLVLNPSWPSVHQLS